VNLGEKIRSLRVEKGWSQSDLGNKANLTKMMVSRYETGSGTPPLEKLARIARVLGVTVDYLLYEDVPRHGPTPVEDVELYERCMQAQQMPDEDRAVVRRVIDALLASHEAKRFAEALSARRSNTG